jgi:hypothetical protein
MAPDLDRGWFAKHPKANLRIRVPYPDEVNRLARRMQGGLPDGLNLLAPEGSAWRVAVIRTDAKTFVKMLVLRREGEDDPLDGFRINLLSLGERVAIEHF